MARAKGTSGNSKPSAEHRKLQRKANQRARDQFAALGMFIQNFEQVVSVLRSHCRDMLMGMRRGVQVSDDPAINRLIHHNICSLVLNHEAIAAHSMIQMWRSMIIENSRAMPNLTEKGNVVVQGMATRIHNQFVELIGVRNRLIHASWRIGYSSLEQDVPGWAIVEKYSVNKSGLQKRLDLPSSLGEIILHAKHAEDILARLGRFLQFYTYHPETMESAFEKVKDQWLSVNPFLSSDDTEREALPEK